MIIYLDGIEYEFVGEISGPEYGQYYFEDYKVYHRGDEIYDHLTQAVIDRLEEKAIEQYVLSQKGIAI